ncbi:hypothetical protein FACS1894147_10890 [Spirochaetia bacterium]|nr:hypothetical protein FACS1894147_10890 [Spirochaetia bacterium]
MAASLKTWSTPVREEKSLGIPCAICGGNKFSPALSCEGFFYVRCSTCGLVQMNPQPQTAEVEDRYRKSHGEDYLAYELANETSFLRLQQLALNDADFGPPNENAHRVLDIGCAAGALLEKLRGEGWETCGVEICKPSAEYGREKRGLDIRELPLEENHFPESAFDAVLASHLIEHLNKPSDFVREVRRVLRPGGRFYLTTPNIAGLQAKIFRGRWRSAIFDHLYLFSVKTLRRLLEQNGFTVEKIITWGGLAAGSAPLPLKQAADKAAKRFGFGDVMMIRSLRK